MRVLAKFKGSQIYVLPMHNVLCVKLIIFTEIRMPAIVLFTLLVKQPALVCVSELYLQTFLSCVVAVYHFLVSNHLWQLRLSCHRIPYLSCGVVSRHIFCSVIDYIRKHFRNLHFAMAIKGKKFLSSLRMYYEMSHL